MRAKRNITPEEVRNAKLLLSKGLSDAEVAAIIGRSVSAVVNIRNGAYDFILENVPNDTPDDSRVYILLKSIDSRLYRQNDDMKAVIDRLTGLNAALVELKNEINVCSSCMTAMLDALNELKSKNSPQAEPEATPTKYPGKDFANWGEVMHNTFAVYGYTLGCALANLTSPLGILDVIVGSLANLIVGSFARKCGKALPTVLFGAVFNGIVVGAELSIVYGSPFLLNAVCVAAGEAVSLLVGALLYHLVGKRLESIWR